MAFLSGFLKDIKDGWTSFKNRNQIIELSFSRVQAYSRCPLMYNLVYNRGWRSGPNGSMALGLSLHRALAAYFSEENKSRTLDQLNDIYDHVWVNEGYKNTQELLDT